MAQFVRLGSMIVNLENVTHIEETSEFIQEGVAIAFVGGDDRLFVTDEQHCTQLRTFMSGMPSIEDSLSQMQDAAGVDDETLFLAEHAANERVESAWVGWARENS
jgi:hypothetical protein